MAMARDQGARSVSSEVGIAGVILAALITAPAIFLSFRFLETVAEFDALFKGFGADLPGLTQFFLSHSVAIAIAFRVCVVCQLGLLVLLMVNRTFKARRVFWALAILTLGTTVTTVVAFYLPIFRLGAAI
jgi:type II secretory pathway component PulF